MLEHFKTPRPLLCRGVPSNTVRSSIQGKPGVSQGPVKDPNSKSQAKKMKRLEATNAKKAQKAREKEQSSIPFATLKVTEDSAVVNT